MTTNAWVLSMNVLQLCYEEINIIYVYVKKSTIYLHIGWRISFVVI